MRDFEFKGPSGPVAGETVSASHGAPIRVPDTVPVFTADYARIGHDLILTDGSAEIFRIEGYFDAPPADLVAANAAVLRGDLVARLAGPAFAGQYAQAGAGFAGSEPIGQVETLAGTAWAQRADGTRVQLQIGTKVYQNDVVFTEDGATASITFADGTIFTLAAASRMVLDEFVYDAGASSGNSGAFSLIEGGFVFIAGEVAKTGGMDVETPTATMGIRGTTVLVDITTESGVTTVEVSLNVDPDGGIGSIELKDLNGNLIATISSTETKWIVSPVDGETREVPRSPEELADDQGILLDAARAWATAAERVEAGGTFVQLSAGSNDVEPPDGDAAEGDPPPPPPGDDPAEGDAPPPPAGDGSGGTPGDGSGFGEETRGANEPPEALDDAVTVAEDTTAVGSLTANDTDIDGDTLAVTEFTDPEHGALVLTETGAYSYTPVANFHGTDSFSYTVSDGNGGTDTATVSLTVTPVNDAPDAADDSGSTAEDGEITGNVLGNDSDIDGDALTVTANTDPTNGTLVIGSDGAYSYTPDEDFHGTDSFTYTVSDGNGGTDTATVSLTVTPVNDAPVATDEAIEVEAGTPYSGQIGASDVDSTTFSYGVKTSPSHGTLSLASDGSYSYAPAAGFTGFDSFEVLVSDGAGGSDTATIIVEVGTEAYDAPTGQSVAMAISADAVGDAPLGNVAIDVTDPQPNTINVTFVLDSSGSIGSAGWAQQTAAVAGALADLADQFDGALTQVDVQIISYSSGAVGYGTFDAYDLVEDAAALDTLVSTLPFLASTTNWEVALDTAYAFFQDQYETNGAETNYLYFITDGNPYPASQDWQGALTDIRQADWDVDILTFGIGSGYNPNLLTVDLPFDGTGDGSDFDEDGVVTQISTASDLTAALASTPLFAAELVDFSLTLVADGTDHGEIATEADLALDTSGLNFDLPLADVAGIAGLLGEENLFTATAVFDLDGDLTTTSDQVSLVSNEAIGVAASARSETGTAGNDLILGSDADDTLAGGAGNDVILGFGGDDILTDDAGADRLDGGAGRDTVLVLAEAGAGSDLLPTLAGSNIEAIDLDNGAVEALDVGLADVIALSDSADTELEALLGRALGDSATILGNTGDSVALDLEEGGEWQQTGSVTDTDGNTLVVYDFVATGSGDVLATLGIDDDIAVTNLAATA